MSRLSLVFAGLFVIFVLACGMFADYGLRGTAWACFAISCFFFGCCIHAEDKGVFHD